MKNITHYKQTEIGEIPEEWESTTFGKLADITSSKRIFASEYQSDGVPFFRGKEIVEKNKGDLVSTELFISEDKFHEIKDKFGVPKENDILLTSVGTLGVPYRVIDGDRFYFKDGNITWFRNLDDITSEFLFHWLNSSFGKRRLIEKSIGSTQQALTIIALKSIEIALPPMEERKEIASILSSLDDKIELNRKMNKTLEDMGKALFKHWFVDFEFPSENGKPYKFSGGEMVEGELGDMPKGWKVGKLSDVARIVTNSVKPNELTKSVPYVGLEHMPRMSLTLDSYGSNEDVGSSKYLFKKNDILFGKLRPYFHKVIVAPFKGVCSTDILVFQPKENHFFSYLLYILYGEEFVHLASAATIGTKMPRMSKDFAMKYAILIPDDEILEKFNKIVLSCTESIQANTKNMASCKQLRDSLLPRLMSGRLRVN